MVDSNLTRYIQDGIKKGYTKEELKKILKENGWSDEEIAEGLGIPQEGRPVPSQEPDLNLSSFVNKALEKGISEDKIRKVLASKNWPVEKIEMAFPKSSKPANTEKIKNKEKKKAGARKIISYMGIFIIISIVLSLSIGVFFYIQALSGYEVTDPNTGELVKGYCLQEDCQNMKNYIYDSIYGKMFLILSIALGVSLILTLLHALTPKKELIIWIANILFFLFIIYLLIMWFMANAP